MLGLIVRKPYIDLILSGKKQWEKTLFAWVLKNPHRIYPIKISGPEVIDVLQPDRIVYVGYGGVLERAITRS